MAVNTAVPDELKNGEESLKMGCPQKLLMPLAGS